MDKMDITISNKMTINTQNYSSIQPSVSLTIKDVPLGSVAETKKELNNILSIFMAEETIELSGMMDAIKTHGFREIVERMETPEQIENRKISLQKSLDMIK